MVAEHNGPGVYVVGGDGLARVKIGMSGTVNRRVVKNHQTSSPVPLRLLGVIPTGTRDEALTLEGELHDRFDAQRIDEPDMSDEWFRVEGPLAEWLNNRKVTR